MKYLHDDGLAELTTILSACLLGGNPTGATSFGRRGDVAGHGPYHAPGLGSRSGRRARGRGRRRRHGHDPPLLTAAYARWLHGRLEAYTMKRAGTDKKVAHTLSNKFVADRESLVRDELQLQAAEAVQQRRKRRSVSTGEAPSSWPVFANSSERGNDYSGSAKLPKTAITTKARSSSLDLPSSMMMPPMVPSFDPARRAATTGTLPTTTSPSFLTAEPGGVGALVNGSRLLTDLILTLNHSFPDYDFSNATAADFVHVPLQRCVQHVNERLSEVAALQDNIDQEERSTATKDCFLSTLWTAINCVVPLSQVQVYSYHGDDSFLRAALTEDYDVGGGTSESSTTNGGEQFYSTVLGRVDEDEDDIDDEYDDDDNNHDRDYPEDEIVGVDAEEDYYGSNPSVAAASSSSEVLWNWNYFFVHKPLKRIVLFTSIETMVRTHVPVVPRRQNTATATSLSSTTTASSALSLGPRTPHSPPLRRRESATTTTTTTTASAAGDSTDDDQASLSSSRVNDGDDYDDDDDHASVDFDMDPADAVSGGIAIGTA